MARSLPARPRLNLESLESRCLPSNGVPTPDHVVVVIEENHTQGQIIGSATAPYFNELANGTSAALFTQSYAVEHPSQPNYLDLFSGSNQGIRDDGIPSALPFTTSNLGSSLLAAGRSFAGYSEDLPTVGFTGATSGAYARKHNPWVNWQGTGINGIPADSNRPLSTFPTDFNQLPTVSFVVPNLQNDMHDGSVATGDAWLRLHLDGYAQWAKTHNSLLIITFDEDDFSSDNRIATLFVGDRVQRGQYSEPINHYSVLRTLEEMYGLPYAGQSAAAAPIQDVWTTPAGNAAFVQSLYSQFLHRAGDLGNPTDAGNWLTALGNGASPTSVAENIGRSSEALGILVDGFYRQFLNREADSEGRAACVTFLQNGGTTEAAIVGFVTSQEFRALYGSDDSFDQSLYAKLLNRRGSDTEVASGTSALSTNGPTGVAQGFTTSSEYRGMVVRRYYAQILNRRGPALDAEVDGWVHSGLDLFTLSIRFASSQEFLSNG